MHRVAAGVEIVAIAALFGTFIGIEGWFGLIEFYKSHFFDHGLIVTADNLIGVALTAILAWIIYAPGAGITAILLPASQRAMLSPAERAVAGFGIGVAVWHVALLILGVANLYYRSVMIVACLVTLAGSARHFAAVASAAMASLSGHVAAIRNGVGLARRFAMLTVVASAAWLLLVQGLYPGGGHDYYTHYFPYYLAVSQHHGLEPNDVWYHYYYSKGCGLIFMGMLLSDPEAPALVTFCYVAFAAAAIGALAERSAPRSLWPFCGALFYLLFYIVSISALGGGQFQKDHEEIAALVTIFSWAICMSGTVQGPYFLIVAASSGVAAAIVTQPAGILLCLFLALLTAIALIRKKWPQVWRYSLAATAVGGTVFAVFALNYAVTGLASDQALDLMLSFANFARLDQWGVIPQIVIVEWIRDNYTAVAPPNIWAAIYQLVYFMRLDVLWVFLTGVTACVVFAALLMRRSVPPPHPAVTLTTIRRTGLLIGFLAVISVFAGRSQNISFSRFSGFFVPLLLLAGIASSSWALRYIGRGRFGWIPRTAVPVLLLCATLLSWQLQQDWMNRAVQATFNGWRYAIGSYSLADAYTHQDTEGFDRAAVFGGINPGDFKASQQVPPGTRIWSMAVNSYCMVPGCAIESVVSFKTSSKLDEIITGPPAGSKRLLREAGLNYFLVSKDDQFLDILPHSRLFFPAEIGRYLGIKWTDGSTFLLTWIGPDTTPIGQQFLTIYEGLLAIPEHQWFKFGDLASQIGTASDSLRARKQWGTPRFPWRAQHEAGG